MKKQTFTLIEVLVALGVFVMGIAPIMGLMAANSRQFKEDMTIFKENDVLYERMREIRDEIHNGSGAFTNSGHDLWRTEESPRYSGVYSTALANQVGRFGFNVIIGIGSDERARAALLDDNEDATHESLRQHTIFLVIGGDN